MALVSLIAFSGCPKQVLKLHFGAIQGTENKNLLVGYGHIIKKA